MSPSRSRRLTSVDPRCRLVLHVDGTATRSCITPIDSIGSSEITTIEGISATSVGAKVQKARLDRKVPQCGYCQSGQIMSASYSPGNNLIKNDVVLLPSGPEEYGFKQA